LAGVARTCAGLEAFAIAKAAKLFAAPGNPGIARHAELVALDPADHDAVLGFCAREGIGLVVIGPEAPLVDGLGDALRAAGVPVFGPNLGAAQLEGSKGLRRICAPAPAYRPRDMSARPIRPRWMAFGLPVVIKADGLAAGKGVVIAETRAEAERPLAAAGEAVVIEEFLTGEEASFFALTDGTTVLPFGSAQDHKRVGEGDTGPNTGGMGAYSPASILTAALQDRVMDEIIRPTVRAMAEAGNALLGNTSKPGLMLTGRWPQADRV
jgi:phosphoribosylamine--glycine ligase